MYIGIKKPILIGLESFNFLICCNFNKNFVTQVNFKFVEFSKLTGTTVYGKVIPY